MKISFHKVKITPNQPAYLCGYEGRNQLCSEVLDDLYASCLKIIEKNEVYVLYSLDLLSLDPELLEQMKRRIVKHGVNYDHILISTTCTHSAPETMVNGIFDDPNHGASPGYREFLVNQMEAAWLGCGEGVEVEVSYAVQKIDGCYGNRNGMELPCDKDVSCIRFDYLKKPIYMIVNIGCYPTVLGSENVKISADLFGAIRDSMRELYQVEVFMMTGAQGNVSNRLYRKSRDEQELQRMNEGICSQLSDLHFKPIEKSGICVKDISYKVDNQKSLIELAKKRDRIIQLMNNADEKEKASLKFGLNYLEMNQRQMKAPYEIISTRLLSIGNLYLVMVGAAMFTQFSIQIKAAFPEHKVLIWGLTDANAGYIVAEDEYGDNFESMLTKFPKGEGEKYAEYIINQLKEFIRDKEKQR